MSSRNGIEKTRDGPGPWLVFQLNKAKIKRQLKSNNIVGWIAFVFQNLWTSFSESKLLNQMIRRSWRSAKFFGRILISFPTQINPGNVYTLRVFRHWYAITISNLLVFSLLCEVVKFGSSVTETPERLLSLTCVELFDLFDFNHRFPFDWCEVPRYCIC